MTRRARLAALALAALVAWPGFAVAAATSAARDGEELVVPSSTCGPYFLIPIEVDGPKPGSRAELLALFDSGGAQLSIDPRAVERVWGRRVRHGTPVKLTGTAAGPVRFGTLRPRAWSMMHLSRVLGVEFDVFLPLWVFGSELLTLDFPRREVRVGGGRLPPPDGVEVFDARGPDKRPYLRVVVGGRARRLLVDSGSSGSIAVRDDGGLRWVTAPRPVRAVQRMESVELREVGRLDEVLEIAGVRLPSPVVSLTDGRELIGTDVMRRFAWTFDRRTRRVRVRPASTEPLLLEPHRGTGAILGPQDAGYRIERVLAATPAARAGLRAGDLVVAVDGTAVYERGCARWEEDGSTEALTWTVRREQESFDVTLPLVDLVP